MVVLFEFAFSTTFEVDDGFEHDFFRPFIRKLMLVVLGIQQEHVSHNPNAIVFVI